ncbi:MAG: MarR family transcriptional regulator [Acidimicrobiales bacterium]|nr:MarR family transcriptional regulator [Acidimicrobiales bacterium]
MQLDTTPDQALVLAIADSWDRLLARLEGGLSHIAGISFAEYRLLRAIALTPGGRASRVDLADVTALSPSGVTRALRPLEKLGFVETQRGERDARLALASLTPAGEELVRNACGVVDDIAAALVEQAPHGPAERDRLVTLLRELLSG